MVKQSEGQHSSHRGPQKEELREALRFQAMMSRITAKFVDLPAEEIDQAIQEALREVGEYFEVDRVVLVRMTPKGEVLPATHFWHSKDFDPEAALEFAADQTYPNTAELLLRKGSFVEGNWEDYPNWQQPERGMMEHLGIKAFAVVKISFDGSVMEFVPLDSLRVRSWPHDIVERVRFLGQVLFNAVERKRMEQGRKKAFEEIKALKERLEKENLVMRDEIQDLSGSQEIIGQSAALQKTLSVAATVADSEATVLLTGETGTGKELVARLIHRLSRRKDRIMVKVNCAAIPESLVESELFGREKGAYTGALAKQIGRFELAHGSTILLDEVGELPLDLQVKLLRVLEEGEFERLGSPHVRKTDVRVIAATNRDLQALMKEGKFRTDLFYRLNVFPICCPPLRERRQDIPALVWHFVNIFNRGRECRIESIHQSDMDNLQYYSWPGNVRELRNVIERAVIFSQGKRLALQLPLEEFEEETGGQTLEEVERKYILKVLEERHWRVGGKLGAAEILGMKRSTLDSRMAKLGIKRPGK